jgi:hypothetical protein
VPGPVLVLAPEQGPGLVPEQVPVPEQWQVPAAALPAGGHSQSVKN